MVASLGLTEAIFSTAEERRVVDQVEKGLEAVEARLLTEIAFADELADVTSRYLLEAGGKRVRPTLTLLTSQLGGGVDDRVLTAATALEITHLASLYHDDVMDEAHMRRGVPSAQTVWGNSVAILSGDLLFARASKLIASLGEDAIRLQADTFERLCLGQLHETIGPRNGEDPIEHYIQVLADKTGSLIAAAARIGISFSEASAAFEAQVEEFGEKIGVAFQLVDDVIDLSAEFEETGKVAGTDLRAGVVTLPLLYLQRDAEIDPEAADLLARIEAGRQAEAPLDAEIAQLREHSATARTIEEAHRWAREAKDAIAPLPEGPVKKALTRFADSIVERSS
ncbi:polyprenyl synthetase family protein [Salinibacterium sp. dk2585]|uniref:polyprenyl synthetase family protein n=1 Tax=unclassified Salinibacterium TaxID=2632331 RepID=UPI0011C2474F|nr:MULTISPECIES: polyprenyl synthetase family protein [unclassified Salinibacterium]QEE62720.1 polyprenyl synthetase family protein [Salinibacterium sp. dk2585]TXK52792.1 polyprenyl synthetase family protein [Salinibacterium sp. dk5596]